MATFTQPGSHTMGACPIQESTGPGVHRAQKGRSLYVPAVLWGEVTPSHCPVPRGGGHLAILFTPRTHLAKVPGPASPVRDRNWHSESRRGSEHIPCQDIWNRFIILR